MMPTDMLPPPATSDATLVRASLAGDREAFESIVARYQGLVCSLAYSATGDLSLSEDLAQETFLTAWRQLVALREPDKLRAWLAGIARNVVLRSRRVWRRQPVHQADRLEDHPESGSSEPMPVDAVMSREEAELLWRALERIPEAYRTPLVLFYREHRSIEAVARHLALTEITVRQRLSRGRKLLESEVVSFVESALEKTSPGRRFTVGVVAALPSAGIPGPMAATGAVFAKAGAGAKGGWVATTTLWASSVAMVGAVAFAWRTAVQEARSPAERRLLVRYGTMQTVGVLVTVGACVFGFPALSGHPLVVGVGMGILLVTNLVAWVWMSDRLCRRLVEIRADEAATGDGAPGGEVGIPDLERTATRRTFRQVIPSLMLLAASALALPWTTRPGVSGIFLAVLGGGVWMGFLWLRRLNAGRSTPMTPAWLPGPGRTWSRRWLGVAAVLVGAAWVAGLVPLAFLPDGLPSVDWEGRGIRVLGGIVFVAVLGAVVWAVWRPRRRS